MITLKTSPLAWITTFTQPFTTGIYQVGLFAKRCAGCITFVVSINHHHKPMEADTSIASYVVKEKTESYQTMSRIQDSNPRNLTIGSVCFTCSCQYVMGSQHGLMGMEKKRQRTWAPAQLCL